MAAEHKYGWRGGEDSHFLCCRHDHLSFGGQALFIDRFPKHVFSDRFPCIHALLYIHASSHIHSYRLSSILLPHIHEDSLVCVCVLVVSVNCDCVYQMLGDRRSRGKHNHVKRCLHPRSGIPALRQDLQARPVRCAWEGVVGAL